MDEQVIRNFLDSPRWVLAGASRGGRKFGNTLLRALRDRGIEVHPVHPEATMLDGLPCWRSLEPALADDALVICLPPASVMVLLPQAAKAGIRQVWLQPGSQSPEVLALASEVGIEAIAGRCLLLHLEPVRGLHALHRWVDRHFRARRGGS